MNFAAVFPPMATPFEERRGRRARHPHQHRKMGTRGPRRHRRARLERRSAAARRRRVRRRHRGRARGAAAGPLLIAGTGRECTRATIDASRRAAALGADAVLVRTPSYFKSRMTPDAFIAHYTAVADAIARAGPPLQLSGRHRRQPAPETVGRLAEHANIAGIKETGTDAAQFAAFVDAAPAAVSPSSLVRRPVSIRGCVSAPAGGILAAACVVPRAVRAALRCTRCRAGTSPRASCSAVDSDRAAA